MQIDDRVLVTPLPNKYKDQGRRSSQCQSDDEIRLEPIVTLTFIEDNLQSSESQGDETEAYVVDAGFAEFAAFEIRRVLNQPRAEQNRDNPNRNVDEENPTPAEIVGDPAAESRANGR